MVVRRKSKNLVHVALPRRTKRRPTFRCKELFWNFTPRRPLKNDMHINNLPDEVLINIFRYFTTKELYCNMRPVCKRWMVLAMAPVLWKKIDVQKEIPTNTLTFWIKTSPLLRIFSMQDRNDANVITEELAKSCKNLESVRMQNCWGNPKCCLIRSSPLCTLVSRCRNLYNFNFSQSSYCRFLSRKFFHLISRDKRNGRIMKKCNYIGPMTVKQMRALFAALRDYEVHDTATIGNVNFKQKFKLRDIIRYFQEIENPRQVVNDVWENLYYGQYGEEDHFPMQMDA